MKTPSQSEFDYVIVGAGSAGATLAARLSENPGINVCLLEAGGADKHMFIHIPFGLSLLSRVKHVNWNYQTVPQRHLNNREMFWPRGKTLGGSSSINAMCYIRGAAEDYDRWAELGAEGWDWESVLPYFKRSESQQHGGSELHGADGPLRVEDLRHTNTLSQSFVKAAEQVGVKHVGDFNSYQREGVGFYQVTQKEGRRCSAARAYLLPAMSRPNLTVITNAQAQRVLLDDKTAKGVEYLQAGERKVATAKHEVILSGGAINTPHLLMLSGIGSANALAEKGVEVNVDLPGVGQNLQDHLDAIVQYRCKAKQGYAVDVRALPMYVSHFFKYLSGRTGLLTSNIAEAGGFVKSALAGQVPDLQYHFLPAILQDHGRSTAFGYGFGIHVCCLYPKSRGSIQLRSSDPQHAPVIDPNYLAHEDDRKVMIDGVRKARAILNAPEFTQYLPREVTPGKDKQSDEDILAFLRQHAETIYHPIGTCKMGAPEDEMAVVNSKLQVRGVRSLRVVDASVMPSLIGGNTNAPTIMIAEKAADLIKTGWH
ncbi:choline dehydrogenase [Aestuariibacter sp. AA17]|uniref:Choline dehydrogenase n=1 Tax=Fluctibacter corallii TaxID=2984329 RepID=A0ABT3A8W2_9ALTE|nr:choline dehydrogenase [Aestuariibacter sp. AA17]MCV2885117.1 choline dehydrogenase [Aestuariibacter sp. AA17]